MGSEIGRYRVERKLGEGGMGVVFAAFDPLLERRVAVKLLRTDRWLDLRSASERLRREAQIAAQLSHPNVVAIHDVGEHEGSVYVAMELVDGPSLRHWLGELARPWREVLAMFFQAGLGLAAAHEAGLVHRDFKPENVLVGERRARVVDFGLARSLGLAAEQDIGLLPAGDPDADTVLVGPTTTTVGRESVGLTTTAVGHESVPVGITLEDTDVGTPANASRSRVVVVGTPAYMAPEVFEGSVADARSDQFAFSVALYEALYGERPFAGTTVRTIAEAVQAGNVRSEPTRTRVPMWLRHILLRGLQKQPDRRHPSLKSMLASIAFTDRIMRE